MSGSHWRDLIPRILSAVVMLAVAVGAFFAGPTAFSLLVALVTGAMVWELSRMLDPRGAQVPLALGCLTALVLMARVFLIESGFQLLDLVIIAAIAAVLGVTSGRDRWIAVAYGAAVGCTGLLAIALIGARSDFSLLLMVLAVVILTDVAGYFAGRLIGGPKFWPRVSPKKTWSGVIAGWICAGIFGVLMARHPGVITQFVFAAVFMSFASQLGDIAESAIKRRAGVKDSSNLIPGHGGFLDRFDGVVGAMLIAAVYVVVF